MCRHSGMVAAISRACSAVKLDSTPRRGSFSHAPVSRTGVVAVAHRGSRRSTPHRPSRTARRCGTDARRARLVVHHRPTGRAQGRRTHPGRPTAHRRRRLRLGSGGQSRLGPSAVGARLGQAGGSSRKRASLKPRPPQRVATSSGRGRVGSGTPRCGLVSGAGRSQSAISAKGSVTRSGSSSHRSRTTIAGWKRSSCAIPQSSAREATTAPQPRQATQGIHPTIDQQPVRTRSWTKRVPRTSPGERTKVPVS